MGIYNSSLYRVRPTMDFIVEDKKFIKERITKLLSLLGINDDIGDVNIKNIYYDGIKKEEILLKPLKEVLVKAIEQYNQNCIVLNPNNDTGKKRTKLQSKDKETIKEALEELNINYDNILKTKRNTKWYVLEGCSQPDVFIETDKYIIVIEGKWTENEVTNSVFNIDGQRNQMVRHIQGAINYKNLNNCKDKKIIAFYIIDEDSSEDLKEQVKENFVDVVNAEAIKLSDEINQETISSYYIPASGPLTWQNVRKALNGNYDFLSKQDIDAVNNEEIKKLNKKINLEISDENIHYLSDAMNVLEKNSNFENIEYENEALATLGDAILKAILCDILYNKNITKGELTLEKESLENNETLKRVSDELKLYEYAHKGIYFNDDNKAEGKGGLDYPNSKHNQYVEAIVGAKYLSDGFEETKKWVKVFLFDNLNKHKNIH